MTRLNFLQWSTFFNSKQSWICRTKSKNKVEKQSRTKSNHFPTSCTVLFLLCSSLFCSCCGIFYHTFFLQVYKGHIDDDSFQKSPLLLDIEDVGRQHIPLIEGVVLRKCNGEGVTRHEVKHGRVRGTIFKPPGAGPFKGRYRISFNLTACTANGRIRQSSELLIAMKILSCLCEK